LLAILINKIGSAITTGNTCYTPQSCLSMELLCHQITSLYVWPSGQRRRSFCQCWHLHPSSPSVLFTGATTKHLSTDV